MVEEFHDVSGKRGVARKRRDGRNSMPVAISPGCHLFPPAASPPRPYNMNPRFEVGKRGRLGKIVERLPSSTPNQRASVAAC